MWWVGMSTHEAATLDEIHGRWNPQPPSPTYTKIVAMAIKKERKIGNSGKPVLQTFCIHPSSLTHNSVKNMQLQSTRIIVIGQILSERFAQDVHLSLYVYF